MAKNSQNGSHKQRTTEERILNYLIRSLLCSYYSTHNKGVFKLHIPEGRDEPAVDFQQEKFGKFMCKGFYGPLKLGSDWTIFGHHKLNKTIFGHNEFNKMYTHSGIVDQ